MKTLKSLTVPSTEDQLTLFAGDSPANHGPLQAQEAAQRMTVTSGQKCAALLPSQIRSGSLQKMSRALMTTNSWASTECSLTWQVSATTQRRLKFRLVPSISPINGVDCGLWATAVAQPANGTPEAFLRRKRESVARGNSMGVSLSDLQMQAKATNKALWPTATTQDNAQLAGQYSKSTGTTLGGAARAMWQTPVADDAVNRKKGKYNSRGEPRLSAEAKLTMWPTPDANCHKQGERGTGTGGGQQLSDDLVKKASGLSDGTEKRGALNPDWVCWLMGYPEGWLD